MKFQNENSGSITYLTYEIGAAEELDRISLGMLTNNKIPGLLPTTYYVKDNQRILRYNVSSKIPLNRFLASRITKKQILTLFRSITDAFLSAEEYMLLTGQFVVDLDWIYVNVGTTEVYLICLPLQEREMPADLRILLKAILFGTQFETHDNGSYIMEISNYLNGSINFSAMDFKELIQQLMGKKEDSALEPSGTSPAIQPPVQPVLRPAPGPTPVLQAVTQSAGYSDVKSAPGIAKHGAESNEEKQESTGGFMIPGRNVPVKENLAEPAKKEKSMFSFLKKDKKEKKEKPNKKKETISELGQQGGNPIPQPAPMVKPVLSKQMVLQDMPVGETTVLSLEPEHTAGETTVLGFSGVSLFRTRTKERISISKPVFHIGKEKSYADYCIADNSAISRSHADIVQEQGQYYIVDNNSLNHTFVSGVQLRSQERTLLQNGDKILLANEEFEFRET